MREGATDYIVKPFDAPALVGSILRHVNHRQADAEPAARCVTPPQANGTDWAQAHAHDSIQADTRDRPQPGSHNPAPWPLIDGIDPIGTPARLGGDFGLFTSMLARLLDEFRDVAPAGPMNDPGALAIHAARMHKLSGSAGMLGASAIQQLAGEADAACAAGRIDRVAQLAPQLALQLEKLRTGTAQLCSAAQHRDG